MGEKPHNHLEIRGLTVLACHGVYQDEQIKPQRFEIDLDVFADLVHSASTDSLSDTIDYTEIIEIAKTEMAAPPVALLEALASRIAEQIINQLSATAVTIWLRKLDPPVKDVIKTAGVCIHLEAK